MSFLDLVQPIQEPVNPFTRVWQEHGRLLPRFLAEFALLPVGFSKAGIPASPCRYQETVPGRGWEVGTWYSDTRGFMFPDGGVYRFPKGAIIWLSDDASIHFVGVTYRSGPKSFEMTLDQATQLLLQFPATLQELGSNRRISDYVNYLYQVDGALMVSKGVWDSDRIEMSAARFLAEWLNATCRILALRCDQVGN